MRAFVAASFCFFKSSSTTSSLNRYFRKIANLLFIFFDNRCLKSILTHKIVNVALILRNLVKSHEVQRPLVLSQKLLWKYFNLRAQCKFWMHRVTFQLGLSIWLKRAKHPTDWRSLKPSNQPQCCYWLCGNLLVSWPCPQRCSGCR